MNRPAIIALMAILLAAAVCAPPATADIYMYIDSQGVMHFTNTPTSTQYRVYIKEKPKRRVGRLQDMDRYDDIIAEAQRRHGVDAPLIKAMVRAESAFDPRAVSRKGALGLMQIMPKNLKRLKVRDPYNPWDNIMGGTRYLKQMLARFEGQLPLALAAYNAGPHAVEQYRGIPPFDETQTYVRKVMRFYATFKNEKRWLASK
ncbi:MAG: lytic transglycosylase domain-containing protein [Desulfosarcinaceae bacterium]|nr:lytic transglycosylase domain-containing protein [Desulfosarcinaceae bacterium]